jgi:hypothetical protein
MSGPIVRKYGFPNHEAIFGRKALEHGVEDDATPAAARAEPAEAPAPPAAQAKKPKPKGRARTKKGSA